MMNAYLKMVMYNNLPVVKQLESVVKNNDIPRLVELIKGGIDVDMYVQPALENRALHLAAGKGHFSCVKHLLQAGADPTLENKLGLTPLFVSFITGKSRCLEVLMTVDKLVKDFEIFWSSKELSNVLWNNSKDETIAVIIIATPNFSTFRSNVIKNLLFLCIRKRFYKCLELFVRTGNRIPTKQLGQFLTSADKTFLDWFSTYIKTPKSLKHYARVAVRKTMQTKCNVYCGALMLEIPYVLVDYLCYCEQYS